MSRKRNISRLSWADTAKGIAIMMSLSLHSGGGRMQGASEFAKNILGGADKTAPYFVVVAIVLGFMSYEKSIQREEKTYKWILLHVVKLIPLYYLAIVVNYITRGPAYIWILPDEHITIWNVLSHIFLVNFWIPNYNDAFGFEWYIGVAIAVYCTIPLLYQFVKTRKSRLACFIIGIFLCHYIQNGLVRLTSNFYPENVAYKFSTYFFWCAFIGCFSVGVLVFGLFKTINNNSCSLVSKSIISVLLFLFAIVLFINSSCDIYRIPFVDTNTICGIAGALIIISVILHTNAIVSNPIVLIAGKYSYYYYLFNYPCITVWNIIFSKIPYPESLNMLFWIFKYICVFLSLWLFAYIMEDVLRKPITTRLSNKVNELRCLN